MSGAEQDHSSVGNDPKRLEWAVEDLADFVGKRWGGEAVVIGADDTSRLRDASRLIVDAIRTEDIIIAQPLLVRLASTETQNFFLTDRIENMQATHDYELTSTSEKLTERIDQLVDERDKYRDGASTLKRMVGKAISGIEGYEDVEDYGNPGFFPFKKLVDDLREDLRLVLENLPDDEEPEEKNEEAV